MLPKRLQTVADMVPFSENMIDIGSDHALLPIYLLNNGRVKQAAAVEKNIGPYERAKKAILAAGLEEKIEVVLGDGFENLSFRGAPAIVTIAGIGGETIASIINRQHWVLKKIKMIIVQPMGKEGEVREALLNHEFQISREELVVDEQRLYQVIVFIPGKSQQINDSLLLELGPMLIENRHPLLPFHLQKALARRKIKAMGLKKSSIQDKELLAELEREINCLEGMLRELKSSDSN